MRLRGLLAALFLFSVGCGESISEDTGADVLSDAQAISTNSQEALAWASDWIAEVKSQPSRLLENEYTSSSTSLERMSSTVKATNRNVCGTFVTRLFQKSLGFDSSDFYKSFNKAMDGTCEVGTVDGDQKGTTSPNAAQYRYKIANCSGTGPIQFTRRTSISQVRSGDVLAVVYPNRTDITGHVMLVRSTPVADSSLPAGPSGSTAYAVAIIDSTSTPHGSSSRYPDWRGGSSGQGLGSGTYILYANSTGAIVATRWSATDSSYTKASTTTLAIGGLR
ncbi:MAG: hypothetical protein U1A78_14715 [Polyangia bacterium]